MKIVFFFLLSLNALAQVPPTLEEVSSRINRDLPEIYDPVTKLRTTTVENNNLVFNFLIDASEKQYKWAMPKVKSQVMSDICSKGREGSVLKHHKASIIYRYENVKGQSLGEFIIRPEHCGLQR